MTHDDAAHEPHQTRQSTPGSSNGSGAKDKWRSSRALRIGAPAIGALIVLGVVFSAGLATGMAWHHGEHEGHSMHGDGHHMHGDHRGGPNDHRGGAGGQGNENDSTTAPSGTSTAPTPPTTTSEPTPTP